MITERLSSLHLRHVLDCHYPEAIHLEVREWEPGSEADRLCSRVDPDLFAVHGS
jgi:hypothetical protein